MQTLKPVTLLHNRPLKFRMRASEAIREGKKQKFVTDSDRLKWGGVLDKNIQTYKMWFLFLKLALELEGQGAELIIKMDTSKGRSRKSKLTKKVKVKRDRYKGWDLDQVLTMHFNEWWKTHSHLFTDDGMSVLKAGDVVDNASGYLTVRINTNRRIRDIYGELRTHIEVAARHQPQARFTVTGNPRPLVLQNRYNALLLKLGDKLTDKEILDHKNKYLRVSDVRISKGYNTEHQSRTMFGLISGNSRVYGAKQILLSVCDGYFVKNPHDDYLS